MNIGLPLLNLPPDLCGMLMLGIGMVIAVSVVWMIAIVVWPCRRRVDSDGRPEIEP